MIVGVGVDIIEVERIRRSLRRFGDKFSRKILCEEEMRSGMSEQRSAAYLAKQFVAKEAVAKSLGTGMSSGVSFRGIMVLRKPSGQPYVELTGKTAALAKQLEIEVIHVSLADEKDYAVAYAVAE